MTTFDDVILVDWLIMLKLLVLILVVVTVSASNEADRWESFKLKYGKSYQHSKEEQKRFAIFQHNLEKIESHNKNYEQGVVSHTMGVNKFSDMTEEEFVNSLTLDGTSTSLTGTANFEVSDEVPETIDWGQLGAVTEVEDQEECNAYWSFSAVGAIEAQYFIKNNELLTLSKQNLVDCASEFGNFGCEGGIMSWAFQYVHKYGIMSEENYPYVGTNGTCKFDADKVVTKVSAIVGITPYSEDALKAAVGTIGPVSVSIDASGFQNYEGGVYDHISCKNLSSNHGALVTGYGTTEDGTEYWLVKNSFGKNWGENGYIRMSRNKDNQCGIATWATYPVL